MRLVAATCWVLIFSACEARAYRAVAATRPRVYTVGGDVKPPVALTRVEINFDECIRQKKPVGMPIIEAVIDENGRVQQARLLKPLHPCAERATLNAVRQWRFKPATLDGKPVAVRYTMTVFIDYR
jgi:protein TonB